MLRYLGSSVIYSVFIKYEYTIETYATGWFGPNDEVVNSVKVEFSYWVKVKREKENNADNNN